MVWQSGSQQLVPAREHGLRDPLLDRASSDPGSVKSAVLGVFTLGKLADTYKLGFLPLPPKNTTCLTLTSTPLFMSALEPTALSLLWGVYVYLDPVQADLLFHSGGAFAICGYHFLMGALRFPDLTVKSSPGHGSGPMGSWS